MKTFAETEISFPLQPPLPPSTPPLPQSHLASLHSFTNFHSSLVPSIRPLFLSALARRDLKFDDTSVLWRLRATGTPHSPVRCRKRRTRWREREIRHGTVRGRSNISGKTPEKYERDHGGGGKSGRLERFFSMNQRTSMMLTTQTVVRRRTEPHRSVQKNPTCPWTLCLNSPVAAQPPPPSPHPLRSRRSRR